jgi:hypothetical protein
MATLDIKCLGGTPTVLPGTAAASQPQVLKYLTPPPLPPLSLLRILFIAATSHSLLSFPLRIGYFSGNGSYEWATDATCALRLVDFDDLPRVKNPPSGYVVSANNPTPSVRSAFNIQHIK